MDLDRAMHVMNNIVIVYTSTAYNSGKHLRELWMLIVSYVTM